MSIEEPAARLIAQNYILDNTKDLEGLLSYVHPNDFDNPSSELTDIDPLDYYQEHIRSTWIFRFYWTDSAEMGSPPPYFRICVDAQTGQVWQQTAPRKPYGQEKRTARKRRRDVRKNDKL